MPVHEVPLGSDRLAVPEGGVETDAAVGDAGPMDARFEDHEGSDAAPLDGARTPPGPGDDDDTEDRSRSAGPTLRDGALGSEDAAAPDAKMSDTVVADSASPDDDDERGDAGERRDEDDRR